MTAIEQYEQWFGSLPDWIQTVLSLDGQKKNDYLCHLVHKREFGGDAQIKLRDAEIQRIKFWENLTIRRHALRQIKQRKIVVEMVPRKRLPKVEQLLDNELGESFKLFEWGEYGRDISDALTIEQVATRVGCKPGRLKMRLAHFGYIKDRLFIEGYWHLEQLEAQEKCHVAQRRQAKHRAKLSLEDKARIRAKDRERKRKSQPEARSKGTKKSQSSAAKSV